MVIKVKFGLNFSNAIQPENGLGTFTVPEVCRG